MEQNCDWKFGGALSTADLLGQMAAADYVDKLPVLYEEFAESARYHGQAAATGGFTSAEDLIAKTPAFWEKYVRQKVDKDFGALYKFLNDPYPDGPNPYLVQIEGDIYPGKWDFVISGIYASTSPSEVTNMSQTIHSRSTSGFSEHRPLDSFSGSIGITRRGK